MRLPPIQSGASQNEQLATTILSIAVPNGGGEAQINLNDLDPRLILFQTMDIADASSVGGYYNRGMKFVTATKYDNKVLLFAATELNSERLQRGWGLIYSKHCSGKRKPF